MKYLIYIIPLFILNIVYAQNETFNKEETLELIAKGHSTIKGEAFAKDNQAPIKGIAIININKKQPAPVGTEVVLIPYTSFLKTGLITTKRPQKKIKNHFLFPKVLLNVLLKPKL